MHWLAIVVLSILACVTYGVIHDQITARICVEYFTIGHPQIIASESPTMLGFVWGVIATWWVGAILGVLLATAARIGGTFEEERWFTAPADGDPVRLQRDVGVACRSGRLRCRVEGLGVACRPSCEECPARKAYCVSH